MFSPIFSNRLKLYPSIFHKATICPLCIVVTGLCWLWEQPFTEAGHWVLLPAVLHPSSQTLYPAAVCKCGSAVGIHSETFHIHILCLCSWMPPICKFSLSEFLLIFHPRPAPALACLKECQHSVFLTCWSHWRVRPRIPWTLWSWSRQRNLYDL